MASFFASEEGSSSPNKLLGAVPFYQQRSGEDRVAAYVARYDAEIRLMDSAFGQVLDFLEEQGLYHENVVVFTADHGESLGEHRYWFEHGWFAYEPSLRVPLMIKGPGRREGRTVHDPVSNLDLLPTLLALLGAPACALLAGSTCGGFPMGPKSSTICARIRGRSGISKGKPRERS